MSNKILFGIDPDVDKSGVAHVRNGKIALHNLRFFDLLKLMATEKVEHGADGITVYVECGFLNKSNWHRVEAGSAKVNAKIGAHTGANHETAKKIVEMCDFLGLKCVQVRPTTSKMNAALFRKVTGIGKPTNQEQRDAYLLIHGR